MLHRMRRGVAVALLVVLAIGMTIAQPPPPSRLVITNAVVIDVAAGRLRPVAAVVVEGGRIAAVHDTMPPALPEGVTPIDAEGATLVPALADLAVQAVPGMDFDADFFYAMSLAHGVMRIRAVDVRLPWGVQQRQRIAAGEVTAPRVWTSGPAIDMRSPFGNRSLPILAGGLLPAAQVADSAAMGREAQRQAAAGADWLRLRENVTPEALKAAIAVARAPKAQVKISLVPVATSMLQAAQVGVRLLDSLGSPLKPLAGSDTTTAAAAEPLTQEARLDEAWSQLGPKEVRSLASQLVRARVALAPMLASLDASRGRVPDVNRDLGYLPEPVRAAVQARLSAAAGLQDDRRARARERQLAFVGEFVKGGGLVVPASGSRADGWPVPGVTVHRELALLVEAGLTPLEALRAATTMAAQLLGEGEVGAWRKGAAADFFAVKGDPLTDLAALGDITLLVRGGEVLDRNVLLRQARRATGRVK